MTVIPIDRARSTFELEPEPEMFEEETWREAANCRQADPESFFPEPNYSVSVQKRVCGACLVRPICLADSLQDSGFIVYGIWGGLTERERRALTPADRRRIHADASAMLVRDRAA